MAHSLLFLAIVSAQEIYAVLFASFAFLLGASIGSFLNVCIYRMPLGLSVYVPKRSFCPKCKYQIPWHSNLPLITWIVQRGKCKNCGAPIAVRYVLVEFLTGVLFLATLWRATALGSWVLFFPLVVFVSLVVVATFIDFEHFIIPDEITWGGAAAGLVFSLGLPQMHQEPWGDAMAHLRSGGWSLLGAGVGFALLWLVSVAGKAAFGKKTLNFDKPEPFTWSCDGDRAKLTVAGDEMWWDEFFTTEKDVMVMDCEKLEIEGVTKENIELRTHYERLEIDGKIYDLNKVKSFSGVVRKISFTRDAMGFGDVKFIACIGAFLGWKAVFFTVMAASIIGAAVGLTTIVLRKREWSAKIPFGPYLSLGALIWMFYGPELLNWYIDLTMPIPVAPTAPLPSFL